MERAIGLVTQVAREGAKLLVFAEAWFPAARQTG
jgi:predicted amidohydrolase